MGVKPIPPFARRKARRKKIPRKSAAVRFYVTVPKWLTDAKSS